MYVSELRGLNQAICLNFWNFYGKNKKNKFKKELRALWAARDNTDLMNTVKSLI